MKHRLSPLTLALGMAISGATSIARAADLPGFLSTAGPGAAIVRCRAVDDGVLAAQSGKYPGGATVSGFVLTMVSQWQGPNGVGATASGTLTVASNNGHAPDVHVNTSAQIVGTDRGNGNGANPHASTAGGQNVSVNGVSQVTQVAGDNNVGTNTAVIAFGPAGPQAAGTAGSPGNPGTSGAPGGGPNTGTSTGSGVPFMATAGTGSPSASASNSAGSVKANVTFGSGGVTLALQTPAGVASQSIAPNSAGQSGSIAQLVQIAGNGQAVSNLLQISIQTRQMSSTLLQQLGVLQALQNAAAIRR
jgi:hypothetical protein